jgi:hypothetical protein
MTGMSPNESGLRGEYLVLLRHGIRQSARLAEQLSHDALVGNEARSLLGRLQAIRGELDSLATGAPIIVPRRTIRSGDMVRRLSAIVELIAANLARMDPAAAPSSLRWRQRHH